MLARTNKESYKNYLFLDDHEKSVLPYEMRLRSNIFDKKYPYFFLTEDYQYANNLVCKGFFKLGKGKIM